MHTKTKITCSNLLLLKTKHLLVCKIKWLHKTTLQIKTKNFINVSNNKLVQMDPFPTIKLKTHQQQHHHQISILQTPICLNKTLLCQ